MNKLDIDNNVVTIPKNEKVELHIFDYQNKKITYNLEANSKLVIYQYGIDIDNDITINLNGKNSEVEYHYSTINYNDHKYNILVVHNEENTTSNIYNHGLNVYSKKLDFNITGKVIKKANKSICNQENQIINLEDGDSTILPNLLIDNYDVISNHSAYIGKFKDELLFYLMSRGISKRVSYDLLIRSFLINGLTSNEDISKLEEEIKKI